MDQTGITTTLKAQTCNSSCLASPSERIVSLTKGPFDCSKTCSTVLLHTKLGYPVCVDR